MSLHIRLEYEVRIPNKDNVWASVSDIYEVEPEDCLSSTALTHNLTEMASHCGLYEPLWRPYKLFGITDKDENKSIILAEDIVEYVEKGLKTLLKNKKSLEKFNPKNGWGSYESLVKFTTHYIWCLKRHPKARVTVSR